MTAYRDRLLNGHYDEPTPVDEATVADLKDELKKLDLPVSGTKDELIARLEEAKTNAA